MVFHRIDARSNEILQNRLKAYDDIISGKNCIVCTSIEALLARTVSPELFASMVREFSVGETISLDEIKEYFIRAGYERIGMVEGKGQFSIRGGIIDFFSPIHQNAVRIELFDDEIDSIRYFDVLTQRSIRKLKIRLHLQGNSLLQRMNSLKEQKTFSQSLARLRASEMIAGRKPPM